MDNWNSSQIKTLKIGGNLRLKNFLNEYIVPEKSDPEFKYFIKATDYYRKLLKFEASGEGSPEKPELLIGLESILTNNTPEESNYF